MKTARLGTGCTPIVLAKSRRRSRITLRGADLSADAAIVFGKEIGIPSERPPRTMCLTARRPRPRREPPQHAPVQHQRAATGPCG